jgi:hypothetical protein
VKSDRRSGSSISSHWLRSSSQAGPSAGWNALNPPAVRSRSVCRTADRVGALELAHVPARVRKHGGRDQAVLPAANDDGVRDTAHHDGPGRVMRAAPAGTPRSMSPRTCRGYPILRIRPAGAPQHGCRPTHDWCADSIGPANKGYVATMTSFRYSLTVEQPGPHEPESDAVVAEQAGFLRLDE